MSALFGYVPAFALAAVLLTVVLRAAQRGAAKERERQERADAASSEQARVDAQFADIVAAMDTEGNPS